MQDDDANKSDAGGEEDNSTDTLYERTNKATERQEEANKKTESLLNRQEELYEKQKLGGISDAGNEKKDVKPEDTDEEYADKFKKGEVNPLGEDGISIN